MYYYYVNALMFKGYIKPRLIASKILPEAIVHF